MEGVTQSTARAIAAVGAANVEVEVVKTPAMMDFRNYLASWGPDWVVFCSSVGLMVVDRLLTAWPVG